VPVLLIWSSLKDMSKVVSVAASIKQKST
jgi:hypothetical protein